LLYCNKGIVPAEGERLAVARRVREPVGGRVRAPRLSARTGELVERVVGVVRRDPVAVFYEHTLAVLVVAVGCECVRTVGTGLFRAHDVSRTVHFFTHPNTLYMLFLTIILWSVPCIVNAFFQPKIVNSIVHYHCQSAVLIFC